MNGVILAIETSGDGGGAAVLRDGELLAEAVVSGPRTHGSELLPCIDRAVREADANRRDIDLIAVNRGPGSYTGLRIGLATAAGLGAALDRPVVGVDCLEVMARQYVTAPGFDVALKRELWPVLDARRGELMTARSLYDNGRLERASGDHLLAPDKLNEQGGRLAIVFGPGVEPYADKLDANHLHVDFEDFLISPQTVGVQAFVQLADVESAVDLPRDPVLPVYFRRVLAKTTEERSREPSAAE